MDVTPLSLSIETMGGIATRLIEKNATIPTRYSQVFTTAANFQTSVEIKVLQGERQMARDNKLIGNFKLSGIKRAMRGVPQIEVTFDIDANGILKVSAKDLGTGKEQYITITASSNLSDRDIEQAIRDAQVYESEDRQKAASVEIYNEAEALMFRTEQLLSQEKKTMDKQQRSRIKDELGELRRVMKKIKLETITEAQAEEIRHAKEQLERTVEDQESGQ